MNPVALASPPASYERRSPNIRQSSADPNCRRPRVSNPAHSSPRAFAVRSEPRDQSPGAIAARREPRNSSPGALAVRWEPSHSCGGGALQRSEKASPLRMRFSAGQFGASPSSSSTWKRGLSNPINCCPPVASGRAQLNRGPNAPLLDVKISKNLSQPLRKVFRLELTPILCFHRLTTNFNRTLVSVRLPRFDAVIKRSPTLVAHRAASQLTRISIVQSHG
jgi:hypothetical protein